MPNFRYYWYRFTAFIFSKRGALTGLALSLLFFTAQRIYEKSLDHFVDFFWGSEKTPASNANQDPKAEEHAAARANFFRLLKITLHSIKQTLWTLQKLPLDYHAGKDSPYTNPANLRRMVSKDYKMVFMPVVAEPGKFHYTANFFFTPPMEIEKSQTYVAFPSTKEVNLAIDLIEKIENAKNSAEHFWENVTDADLEKSPTWNLSAPDNNEIDRALVRAKFARNYFKDVEELRSILNELRSRYGEMVEIPF